MKNFVIWKLSIPIEDINMCSEKIKAYNLSYSDISKKDFNISDFKSNFSLRGQNRFLMAREHPGQICGLRRRIPLCSNGSLVKLWSWGCIPWHYLVTIPARLGFGPQSTPYPHHTHGLRSIKQVYRVWYLIFSIFTFHNIQYKISSPLTTDA